VEKVRSPADRRRVPGWQAAILRFHLAEKSQDDPADQAFAAFQKHRDRQTRLHPDGCARPMRRGCILRAQGGVLGDNADESSAIRPSPTRVAAIHCLLVRSAGARYWLNMKAPDKQVAASGDAGLQPVVAWSHRVPSSHGIGVEKRHAALLSALQKHRSVVHRLLPVGPNASDWARPGGNPLLLLGWDTLLQSIRHGSLPDGVWLDLDEVPSRREKGMPDSGAARRAAMHRLLEARYLPKCGRIVLCSERERGLLREAHPGIDPDRVWVWPNVVHIPPLPPLSGEAGSHLLFVGYQRYTPNREGFQWFVREVWPVLRQSLPAIHCHVVGEGSEGLPTADGVHYHGKQPRLEPFYANTMAAIAPIFSGGGTRIKILEAMAHGRPVVSTSFGAAGLAVRHGDHLWIADTPAAFAEAIVRLSANADLRARLARAGNAWVTRCHSPAVLESVVGHCLRSSQA